MKKNWKPFVALLLSFTYFFQITAAHSSGIVDVVLTDPDGTNLLSRAYNYISGQNANDTTSYPGNFSNPTIDVAGASAIVSGVTLVGSINPSAPDTSLTPDYEFMEWYLDELMAPSS